MARYFIQLAYRGTAYHGWQLQENAHTVQAEFNRALSVYLREPIETVGAGRTDTGVHAKFYVAHFDCTDERLEEEQPIHLHKLNCILPNDISVFAIKKMHDGAHARFDALSRTYRYVISQVKNPFCRDTAYAYYPPLDVEAMNKAAELLLTYSDFGSFCKLHADNKTTICQLSHARWVKEADEMLVFTITSDRFLRDMVRAIVGSLMEVGKNRLSLDEFRGIVEAKNRQSAFSSVPAQGLFLSNVSYPYDIG